MTVVITWNDGAGLTYSLDADSGDLGGARFVKRSTFRQGREVPDEGYAIDSFVLSIYKTGLAYFIATMEKVNESWKLYDGNATFNPPYCILQTSEESASRYSIIKKIEYNIPEWVYDEGVSWGEVEVSVIRESWFFDRIPTDPWDTAEAGATIYMNNTSGQKNWVDLSSVEGDLPAFTRVTVSDNSGTTSDFNVVTIVSVPKTEIVTDSIHLSSTTSTRTLSNVNSYKGHWHTYVLARYAGTGTADNSNSIAFIHGSIGSGAVGNTPVYILQTPDNNTEFGLYYMGISEFPLGSSVPDITFSGSYVIRNYVTDGTPADVDFAGSVFIPASGDIFSMQNKYPDTLTGSKYYVADGRYQRVYTLNNSSSTLR